MSWHPSSFVAVERRRMGRVAAVALLAAVLTACASAGARADLAPTHRHDAISAGAVGRASSDGVNPGWRLVPGSSARVVAHPSSAGSLDDNAAVSLRLVAVANASVGAAGPSAWASTAPSRAPPTVVS